MKNNINKYFKASNLTVLFAILVFTLIFGINTACSQLNIKSVIPSSLKIVQLSDVHFDTETTTDGKRLIASSPKLLDDAIDQINHLKNIDFVVFSGDSINRPSESDFKKFLTKINTLKYPWYLSTGNHEISVGGVLSKQRRLELISQYNKNFIETKSYYYIKPKKGYIFIFMDGVIDRKVSAHGYFPKTELKWLDKTLSYNAELKAVIIQHFPLVEPCKSSDHTVLNKKGYLNVLSKHKNVIAVLSGHYHVPMVKKVGKTLFISSPALVQYPNAFREITFDSENGHDKIITKFIPTRLKELQEKSRQSMGLSNIYLEGTGTYILN